MPEHCRGTAQTSAPAVDHLGYPCTSVCVCVCVCEGVRGDLDELEEKVEQLLVG